jgi:hypothetical protein
VPGIDALRACRAEVNAEVARCARVAPRIAGAVALLRFSSTAQVHPIVAIRWTRRLRGLIVIAANDGFLPGRVNFAVRCSEADRDLVAWLRALPTGPLAGEYAHGHPRATGGSLSPDDFDRFLAAAGLTPWSPPPRSRSSAGRTPSPPATPRTRACRPTRSG